MDEAGVPMTKPIEGRHGDGVYLYRGIRIVRGRDRYAPACAQWTAELPGGGTILADTIRQMVERIDEAAGR